MIVVGTSLRVSATVQKDGAAADLTDASVALVICKPRGEKSSYPAIIDDALAGTVHVDLPASEVDEAGAWTAWADVVLSGGAKLVTGAKIVEIAAEGTVG